MVSRTLDAGNLLERSRRLPPGVVIVFDADLVRPDNESSAEFWRDLTDPPDAPPLVLYAREALLTPELDHTIGRATGYVGAWRPDAAQKLRDALRLAPMDPAIRVCCG